MSTQLFADTLDRALEVRNLATTRGSSRLQICHYVTENGTFLQFKNRQNKI